MAAEDPLLRGVHVDDLDGLVEAAAEDPALVLPGAVQHREAVADGGPLGVGGHVVQPDCLVPAGDQEQAGRLRAELHRGDPVLGGRLQLVLRLALRHGGDQLSTFSV